MSVSLTGSCLEAGKSSPIYSDVLSCSLLQLKNILHRNLIYSLSKFPDTMRVFAAIVTFSLSVFSSCLSPL